LIDDDNDDHDDHDDDDDDDVTPARIPRVLVAHVL